MAMKHLLLELDDSPDADSSRDVAIELARAHEGFVTGLYVHITRTPRLPYTTATMISAQMSSELNRAARTDVEDQQRIQDETIDRFMRAAAAAGVAADHHVELVGEGGTPTPHLVRYGRTADAIVIGRKSDADGDPANLDVVHDVLFGAGVPVIVVPSKLMDGAGRRVLIAWNGSRESARAVKDALPFLEKAERVTVLCVGQTRAGANIRPGEEVTRYLGYHGIEASLDNIDEGSMTVGDAILMHQGDIGADMLVMGGYGHSRLREFVLGGVTKRILERCPTPVLMSH